MRWSHSAAKAKSTAGTTTEATHSPPITVSKNRASF